MILPELDRISDQLNAMLEKELRDSFESRLKRFVPKSRRKMWRKFYKVWEEEERAKRTLRDDYVNDEIDQQVFADVKEMIESQNTSSARRPLKNLASTLRMEADALYPFIPFHDWVDAMLASAGKMGDFDG